MFKDFKKKEENWLFLKNQINNCSVNKKARPNY